MSEDAWLMDHAVVWYQGLTPDERAELLRRLDAVPRAEVLRLAEEDAHEHDGQGTVGRIAAQGIRVFAARLRAPEQAARIARRLELPQWPAPQHQGCPGPHVWTVAADGTVWCRACSRE